MSVKPQLGHFRSATQAMHRRAQRAEGEVARLKEQLAAVENSREHWRKAWSDKYQEAKRLRDALDAKDYLG
jgi:hypothetical protein